MNKRLVMAGVLFAVLWIGFMFFSSGDQTVARAIILVIIGTVTAAAWVWCMKKLGHFTKNS